eukprot:1147913-Pelagomonas_calceolata.AAC.4
MTATRNWRRLWELLLSGMSGWMEMFRLNGTKGSGTGGLVGSWGIAPGRWRAAAAAGEGTVFADGPA